MFKQRKKLEEYNPVDDATSKSLLSTILNGANTSYDILAQSTGSTASDLRNWAKIKRLLPTCQVYEDIEAYINNSSAATKMTIQNIYKIVRTSERGPFDESYRIMLWHGTKPNSIPGIINTGFRTGTGGLFGGGIYFADRIAKSQGYTSKNATGSAFFILAEVSPGKVYKAHHHHSDYKSPPPKFDSVKGMGSQIPTWKENRFYHGAIMPCGISAKNPRHEQYDMVFNEYIVYDASRIIVRFVVEVKF